jgi:delta-1-pyrroline-5-carboxylate synthetase
MTNLKYIVYLSCSFSDLQKPQGDLDGKACAAVGQSSLMALYDTMFSQVEPKLSWLISFVFLF